MPYNYLLNSSPLLAMATFTDPASSRKNISKLVYQSEAGSTKDTPYLALTGKQWGVLGEYIWENWTPYNGPVLYV